MATTDLTLQQVAKIMGVCVETLRRMVRKGKLKGCYKVGGQFRMTRKALDAFRKMPKGD